MTEMMPILAIAAVIVALAAVAVMAVVLIRSCASAEPQPDVLAELTQAQGAAAQRLEAMIRMLGDRQSQLQNAVNERLDNVSHRLGESLQKTTQHTSEHLQKLHERLGVIDSAQKNITTLASQVTSLQSVLSNKQERGAFGQWRMESIVQDCLPKGAYAFQHTLSNRTRPDCCVFMPDNRALVIDAKFPLESVTAYRDAKSDEERKLAGQRVRVDIGKHVTDINEKYLIPGETQDFALMFVPSEAVYAEVSDRFDDLVQKAYRAHVVLMSPSLLMLAIALVQQNQKDARMREAADKIQDEVGRLVKDVGLLGDRVRKLQAHFNQASDDIRQSIISVEKIESRGEKIQQVDVAANDTAESNVIAAPIRRLEAGVSQGSSPAARGRMADALAVYLKRRVLIVLFLGFSSGLPLALSGSTLLIWMTESGVNLGTIGLFALVGTPYTIKFLWAPVIDALDVPFLSRRFGRRRGWLLLSQLLLIAAIVFLGACDPAVSPLLVAFGALLVATASATQDIIVDAFRVESLDESEQAAGMASYVAAYRIGMLASTAGALFIVSGFQSAGLDHYGAWRAGYTVMAALVLLGVVTTLIAVEPEKSVQADAAHARENSLSRVIEAAVGAFSEFLSRDLAFVALAFVVLYKFTDALSGAMTAPFVIDLGFSRNEYAAIIKGVGLAATLIGGFAGGFVARAYSLPRSLLIGGLLQAFANLAFSWQAIVGLNAAWLTFAIIAENFTSAIGTVIFVAYLSALCRNPLHTATQYALLTALAAFGRTYLSSGAGFIAASAGWVWFFAICSVAGLPALLLLAWLQRRGHFDGLLPAKT